MPSDDKPKGPASYFPSIEKTYGQPIAHWLGILDGMKDKKSTWSRSPCSRASTSWATAMPMRWWRFISRARAVKGRCP